MTPPGTPGGVVSFHAAQRRLDRRRQDQSDAIDCRRDSFREESPARSSAGSIPSSRLSLTRGRAGFGSLVLIGALGLSMSPAIPATTVRDQEVAGVATTGGEDPGIVGDSGGYATAVAQAHPHPNPIGRTDPEIGRASCRERV